MKILEDLHPIVVAHRAFALALESAEEALQLILQAQSAARRAGKEVPQLAPHLEEFIADMEEMTSYVKVGGNPETEQRKLAHMDKITQYFQDNMELLNREYKKSFDAFVEEEELDVLGDMSLGDFKKA